MAPLCLIRPRSRAECTFPLDLGFVAGAFPEVETKGFDLLLDPAPVWGAELHYLSPGDDRAETDRLAANIRAAGGTVLIGGGVPAVADPLGLEPGPDRVDYRLFDLHRYEPSLFGPGTTGAPLLTSRGCHWNCSWCEVPASEPNGFRPRSTEDLGADVASAMELGVRHFAIEDDHFTADRDHVEAVCDALSAAHVSWECLNGVRPDTLDPDLIRRMSAAGCVHLAIGIESDDQQILASHNRAYDPQRLDAVIATCRLEGVQVTGYFLLDLGRPSRINRAAQVLRVSASGLSMAHFSWLDPPGRAARLAANLCVYAHPIRLGSLIRAGKLGLEKWPKIRAKLRRL